MRTVLFVCVENTFRSVLSEAVFEAIVVLEDDPRLNAGTGSRMRIDGRIQMDAALMNWDREAGSVAAIEEVKNPIRVAHDVLKTPHILLVGPDAIAFARSKGHARYDPSTPESRRHLEESLEKIRNGRLPRYARKWKGVAIHDTVGAVARDRRGRFATGSSTGASRSCSRAGSATHRSSARDCTPALAARSPSPGSARRSSSRFCRSSSTTGSRTGCRRSARPIGGLRCSPTTCRSESSRSRRGDGARPPIATWRSSHHPRVEPFKRAHVITDHVTVCRGRLS